MKLAKKITARGKVIACENAYHGSTQGAESLRSDEDYKRAFYPLIPGIKHIRFNNDLDIGQIDDQTACVILEPVQAEAGVYVPETGYLKKIRKRCDEMGALLILDEIQTGFGRTGRLFAFQKFGLVPDIVIMGKAMGGGVPISAFASSQKIMQELIKNPSLGHITTFGGHPLSCAAALANLEVLINEDLILQVEEKTAMFKEYLRHPIVREIRSAGLMMAVELTHRKYLKHVVNACMKSGVIIDYFLFNKASFRLAPPLVISAWEIQQACAFIQECFDEVMGRYAKS